MELKVNVNNSPKDGFSKNILLDISSLSEKLEDSFCFEEEKLFLKKEFHITLIGNEDSLILRNSLIELFGENNLEDIYKDLEIKIEELLEENSASLLDKFYVLKKEYSEEETRISVVQIIKTNLIEKFREMLKVNYGIILSKDYPEPHITLYSQKENFGVGLYTEEDLEKYCVKRLVSLS